MVRRDPEVSFGATAQQDWSALLVENLGDALVACDRSGAVVTMNAAAESLTGWHRDEAAGKFWNQIFHFEPDMRCPVLRALHECAVTSEARIPVTLPRLSRKITASLSVSPVQDSEGCIHGAVLLLRDVTGIRRMEELYHRARHLEGMQRLAEGLAHNLNDLVTVIAGYSEALVHSLGAGAEERRGASMIREASEKASAIVRQILAFSRQPAAQARRLDLNAALDAAEQVLIPELGPRIRVEKSLDPNLVHVESDPGHLEQIVMTLILNARDALPHGGTIRIRTTNFDFSEQLACNYPDVVPGNYALLEIEDNGLGMDFATQTYIFEPFFTTKAPEKAAGLSLAALYGLVKHAGGHVIFESQPGAGARFSVYWPAAPDPVPVPIDSYAPLAAPSLETILLVEDQPETRLLTRKLLIHMGYCVLDASNGAEALHILHEYEEPVHLLLTDIIMPGVGGIELAQRIEAIRPGIKVLFLSAFSQYALEHHGALMRGAHILQKPVTARGLSEKVRQVLDGPAHGIVLS